MVEHAPVDETIESYRSAFATGPVGRWTSGWEFWPGPVTRWAFEADGSGSFVDTSSSQDGRVTSFTWESNGDCAILLREISSDELLTSGADPEGDDPEAEPSKRIAYDFKKLDVHGVMMFEVPEHDTFKFYWTLNYLKRIG